MIPNIALKRKSPLDNSNVLIATTANHNSISTLTKKFRGTNYDEKVNQNEHRMSLLSSSSSTTHKTKQEPKKMTILNGEQNHTSYKRLDEDEMTPVVLAEYRRLQHELQCQEALLVLMQKLKTNQRLVSQTNNNTTNNSLKQRTTTATPTPTPTTATKLSQQSSVIDGKNPILATKQHQQNNTNRPIPTKPPHPNQYTVNRSNNNSSQIAQQQSSKNSQSIPQTIRQSNNTNSSSIPPATATRISSSVPNAATKHSSNTSTTNNTSKSNGVAAEQHLLNAKLALRKQLEQTLLQIPTPKPSTCDLTFIPGVNGWSEFLSFLGLEQAMNTYSDIANRRSHEISMNLPHVCVQCGTDWSVTWHEMSSNSDTNSDDKILCDRCTKTSQKKLLKQDHSNRLRQAFIKALQQEKELDAKFQQQSTLIPTNTVKQSSSIQPPPPPPPPQQQHHQSKHVHQTNKHSNKPLSTKTSSNHHHHHHNNNNNNSTNNNNNHHSHHHHSGKSSNSSKHHNTNSSAMSALTPSSAETLASTLAALQTNEQMEFFQKHFLSNMLPFAVANQAAAALAAKSSQQQQQQQAALAALPAMAASLMRQPNPAQYLLDMIPQATKQQHHHHSK
ncbi:unnamed protein product [Rotaria magnacalcarata]|uniref:Uncharacterized protein n=1 Tax=Rotaria magnacalcarata TaxID=392030 RepID=A0A816PNP6_9BILA|nr:unnamed protein product [Rotaria magnacalcarata]CAF3952543.1 unnamed protein product [Rotaria magnacalcarata]